MQSISYRVFGPFSTYFWWMLPQKYCWSTLKTSFLEVTRWILSNWTRNSAKNVVQIFLLPRLKVPTQWEKSGSLYISHFETARTGPGGLDRFTNSTGSVKSGNSPVESFEKSPLWTLFLAIKTRDRHRAGLPCPTGRIYFFALPC